MEITHGPSEMSKVARQSDETVCPVVLLVDRVLALLTLWTMAVCPLAFTRSILLLFQICGFGYHT